MAPLCVPENIEADRAHSSRTTWLLTAGAALILLSLQGWLTFREPIFSPIDELQHADYVRSIAEEGHPPIYGAALIDRRLLDLAVHVYPGHATSQQLDPAIVGTSNLKSYESLQLPAYYLAMAPIYRLLDFDPRIAVIGLRLVNVGLSMLLLLISAAVAGKVFPTARRLAPFVALSLMVFPGIALRSSQVTNQVLAALVVGVLLYQLVREEESVTSRHAFIEGGLLALALLTKLTAVAVGPAVAVAWLMRPRGLRGRLIAGLAAFIVVCLPWLAWSGLTYGSPFPWMVRHYSPPLWNTTFPFPNSGPQWLKLASLWVRYYWGPWEWLTPVGPLRSFQRLVEMAGTTLLSAAFLFGLLKLRFGGRTRRWRAVAIAVTSVIGFVAGYMIFVLSLHRIFETDSRELYVLVTPLTVLLMSLLASLPRRVGAAGLALWVAALLLTDYGYFVIGTCQRCW